MLKQVRLLINSLLLLTIPSTGLYPQNTSVISVHVEEKIATSFNMGRFLSYDDILNLISDLEAGELEKKYSEVDLEKITQLFILLAQEGALLSGLEVEVLEKDIQALLHTEYDQYEYSFSTNIEPSFIIEPTILYDQGEFVLCKSWLKKKWDKAIAFVNKNKKIILIGAAVAVAVTVVVCVVVASAGAAALGAGAIGAAALGQGAEDKEKNTVLPQETQGMEMMALPEPSLAFSAVEDLPMLHAVFEEPISHFKEAIALDQPLQISSVAQEDIDSSFIEVVKNLGAHLAHQTLDGVAELGSWFPELFEEVKDVTQNISETYLSSIDTHDITPKANYEKFLANGHEVIDDIFSTNQADLYTPETKANHPNPFVSSILPLPGLFTGSSFDKLAEAGKFVDRAGFTKAGRGIMKHGYRPDTVFPKPIGNPSQVNECGQKVLESILNHPEKKLIPREHKQFGKIVDIHAPDIGGVRYSADGSFIGFLEPRQ